LQVKEWLLQNTRAIVQALNEEKVNSALFDQVTQAYQAADGKYLPVPVSLRQLTAADYSDAAVAALPQIQERERLQANDPYERIDPRELQREHPLMVFLRTLLPYVRTETLEEDLEQLERQQFQ